MKRNTVFFVLLLTFAFIARLQAQMPASLYEEWRKTSYPAGDAVVSTNPSPLLWKSDKYWEKRKVTYNVYLSRNAAFPKAETQSSMNQRYCFYNPHRKLESGKWYWKYETVENGKVSSSEVYSFIVPESADGLITPTAEEFRNNISKSHPRVMNYGRSMEDIHRDAPQHRLYKSIINTAKEAAAKQIYRGAVTDPNPATARRLNQKAGKEVALYHELLEGYTLSADNDMKDALLKRTDVLLSWPTNDLLGSKVLTALALGYDMLYDELTAETKQQILTTIDKQFKEGLARWPGFTEARQVENHFWQMELAGNFTAALATLGELESATEMLDYTYGLFIARFPNLATQDGGWNEGEGYYSVNQTAVVDMALLLKKLGGIDIFKMGWYRNLPDYFTYFSPVASPVSGFGDMHDRVETGGLKGRSEMLTIGCEENNPYALYRFFQSVRPVESFFGATADEKYWRKPLAKTEPWYQIVNNISVAPKRAKAPTNQPTDKVFYGVGAAAMHSCLADPAKDVTVFFRSSPFGSKGHAHADQNSFNISRHGERLFYPTGYYTSFADLHSLTSYKHTRACNSMLINGYGQAFGHEGYGWIKRHIEGENMSYVCGEAGEAYKKTTDKQFADFMKEKGIKQDAHFGMGDTPMKKFERHVVFVRPDVVVIYDVLEADEASEWSLLLHTMRPSTVDKNKLTVETSRSYAEAQVFGSTAVKGSVTNKFFSPANDFKKKYQNGTPDQYHATFCNTEKVKQMRYLTIINMCDKGAKVTALKSSGKGKWKIGALQIEAEMDATKAPHATIKYGKEQLSIGAEETTLNGTKGTVSSKNQMPTGNYNYLKAMNK